MKRLRIKQPFSFYLLSFLLPLLIMTIILATFGIWWGSETTILASDGFHQYVIFNQTLRTVLHGEASFFYTFTSGLGLNFYALSAYYLGSFLSPLVYFFDLSSMPDALYLFTIVKFGLTGLSSYFSLSKLYPKLTSSFSLLLSTSLSLMSFATSQLEINSWLDVFILLPLILLGLHRLIEGKGRLLYFTSLTCLFLQNYYFGYMAAIFLTLWYLVQLSWHVKQRIKSLPDFLFVSLLAALSSCIVLLPVYLDLKTHGETFTKIVNFKTEYSWYFDLIAKQLVGSFDTTKFGSIPMISVGLLPFILSLLFFSLKTVKLSVKLAYAALLTFVVASFSIQYLDLFWQGMHAPNMFLHRYAWVFSFILIYMAAETLSRLHEIRMFSLSTIFTLISIGVGLTFCFKNHYSFLGNIQFLLTAEFLFAYFLLFALFIRKKCSFSFFNLACLFFVLGEVSIHTHFQVSGLAAEWHFPSRANYQDKLTDIDKLVKYTKENHPSFYRTERLLPQTGNDSMKFHYNGISQFSSIRNTASSSLLDKLGFRSDGTNLNLRYQNNTIIADSLFGVAYNLASTDPAKFGFEFIQGMDTISLYKNQYAQPLALLTEGTYQDIPMTHLTLDNQSHFLNQLTGLNLQYYFPLSPQQNENGLEFGNRVTVHQLEGEEMARVTYTLLVPAHSQVYLNLPSLHFTNEDHKTVRVSVNNLSRDFTLDNSFPLFTIGHFTEEELVQVTLQFPQNSQVSYAPPQFYRLDLQHYQEAMAILSAKEVVVTTKANKVMATYETKKDSSLLFTLPYDKGWTAQQDGQSLPIQRAQNGLMKVDVPAGKGTIVLTFVPQGFLTGLTLSLLGLFLFGLYHQWRMRGQKLLTQEKTS